MSLPLSRAKKLTTAALAATTADDLLVRVTSTREGNTRFANGAITTSGEIERVDVSITATLSGRSATVSGTGVDAKSIVSLVRSAEQLAVMSPPDPESMPTLPAQRYLVVPGPDAATTKLDAAARARLVDELLSSLRPFDGVVSGFFEQGARSTTIAGKGGVFAHHEGTSVSMTCTVRTKDGRSSGRGAFVGARVGDLDPKQVGRQAAEKADMGRDPQKRGPGRARVLLEAQAVGDLLSFLLGSMAQRDVDEGRSAFSVGASGPSVGQKLFDARIDLLSDPGDSEHPSAPFSGDGEAHPQVRWIRSGVLERLHCSRYWARKTGSKSLPSPSTLRLAGEGRSLVDLLRAADRGVFVSRFWYNRMLDPRSILVTGLTRDGTFSIEEGRIVAAVNSFRYNDSPLTLLRRVVATGEPRRVESGGMVMIVPPMVVDDFNFESVSDAV